jgi:hypothetical protein
MVEGSLTDAALPSGAVAHRWVFDDSGTSGIDIIDYTQRMANPPPR